MLHSYIVYTIYYIVIYLIEIPHDTSVLKITLDDLWTSWVPVIIAVLDYTDASIYKSVKDCEYNTIVISIIVRI